MLLDDVLSRWEGFFLVLFLLIYLTYAWHTSKIEQPASHGSTDAPTRRGDTWIMIVVCVLAGGLFLVLGSRLLVHGAVGISENLGINQAVIGLTVVAVGTSLPEIAASTVAALRGNTDMALGNIVGSNIWNILAVLGIASIATELPRGNVSWDMLGLCLAVSLALVLVALTERRITRTEGGILVLTYICYQVFLYTIAVI
jgi:cation:H+ antiporter